MSRAYVEIAFTPAVRRIQEERGSREQYAFLDGAPERGDRLTEREAAFIETRDTLFQATVGETGWPYVQHRGGPPGFVKVLDPATLAFPDFRGNVQYISVGNLTRDDRLALIFMDFAKQRRLKVYGRVRFVDGDTDPELMARLQLPDYRARVERAFIVSVEAYDWNCPQHITPRFTEAEIESMMAPLQARAERAERAAAARVPSAPGEIGDGPLALVVSGIRQLTPRIRAFELRAVDGVPLPNVTAGAHLPVPVKLADGTTATRQYSIVRCPPDQRFYEIAVFRDDDGRGGSRFLHRDVGIGTRLRCDVPQNHFPLAAGGGPVVLVAGGIGVTPILAMLLEAQRGGRSCAVHYAVRSLDEGAYLEELRAAAGHALVTYASGDGHRMDVPGIVRSAVRAGAELYVCGPARMLEAFRRECATHGMNPEHLHVEAFAPAEVRPDDRVIEVALRRSGRTVRVAPGESILEAVERVGIAAPFGCRAGTCGACAVKVVEGSAEHRDAALSIVEGTKAGVMCICVSRAVGDSLVLDL